MTKRGKNSDGFLKNNYENHQTPCNGTGSLHGPLFTSCSLNYGVFLLKIKMGDAFNTALAFLIVGALITWSIYLLRKKGSG